MPWSGPREADGAAPWLCVVSGTQAGLPDGSLLSILHPPPNPTPPHHPPGTAPAGACSPSLAGLGNPLLFTVV